MNFAGRHHNFGAIDCDVHPAVENMRQLLPYLDENWREIMAQRQTFNLESISYPPNGALSARPDWRPKTGRAGGNLDLLRSQALAPFDTSVAICNCLYDVQLLFDGEMAAAFAQAVNNWMAREWLDREPRLRASIVIPMQNPDIAVDVIERYAKDKRFVQILMLVMGEMPLGRRYYWPIYAAAERHGLPIGIHAGSSYRHPPTPVGWTSYYIENYVAQAQAFQSQVTSLICEGVFSKYPNLRVVMLESGFTWLPAHLWRLNKEWRAMRSEVPWMDRPPEEIVRSNFRFTLEPVDGPPDPKQFERFLDHMGSDQLLLFSTDYPHWHFDGDAAIPEGMPASMLQKVLVDNPRETYPRLAQVTQ